MSSVLLAVVIVSVDLISINILCLFLPNLQYSRNITIDQSISTCIFDVGFQEAFLRLFRGVQSYMKYLGAPALIWIYGSPTY